MSGRILLFTVQAQQVRKFLMRKFYRVSSKLDPEVKTLLSQYFEALNRFRLGEEAPERHVRTVEVGIFGDTEVVEPFIAFVHNKEFQLA